jgi:hypothetical protein
MGAFGIMEDVTAEVMRERRQAACRPRHPTGSGQSEIRVRWKLRAERDGVGPRWPW